MSDYLGVDYDVSAPWPHHVANSWDKDVDASGICTRLRGKVVDHGGSVAEHTLAYEADRPAYNVRHFRRFNPSYTTHQANLNRADRWMFLRTLNIALARGWLVRDGDLIAVGPVTPPVYNDTPTPADVAEFVALRDIGHVPGDITEITGWSLPIIQRELAKVPSDYDEVVLRPWQRVDADRWTSNDRRFQVIKKNRYQWDACEGDTVLSTESSSVQAKQWIEYFVCARRGEVPTGRFSTASVLSERRHVRAATDSSGDYSRRSTDDEES